jgi:hypothetical protein
MTRSYWQYKTRFGTFRIVLRAGSFHPFFEEEDLGAYHSVDGALDDLVGGTYFWRQGFRGNRPTKQLVSCRPTRIATKRRSL